MSWFQVIALAMVQGITEFLPISSSAHLILLSRWLGWPDQGLAFDMAVHAGSLVAVIVYLRWDLAQLLRGLAPTRALPHVGLPSLAWPLLIGTLPVAVTGLLIQDWVATVGRGPVVLGVTSVAFALLLCAADRFGRRARTLGAAGWLDVLWMGLLQALALIPGTSRSGVTMTAGLSTGLTREAAARLSFLMSVPVGLLVAFKDLLDLHREVEAEPVQLAAGFIVAALTAFVAIGALLRWLQRRGMMPFVVYRVVLGMVLLAEGIGWLRLPLAGGGG